jgi:hypothetical protein
VFGGVMSNPRAVKVVGPIPEKEVRSLVVKTVNGAFEIHLGPMKVCRNNEGIDIKADANFVPVLTEDTESTTIYEYRDGIE